MTYRFLITGYCTKPTNYTSIGVSVVKGHEALLSCTKVEEPQIIVLP